MPCGAGRDDALQDATVRVMAAASEAFSGWFRAMRSCIGRGRERQAEFRLKNGLPKTAKVPYEPSELTPGEKASSSLAESITRALFGDSPADYAKEKFDRAISSGDMRAFKIRLLFLKARDALEASGVPMKRPFVQYLDLFISDSEEKAGCIPDPSPRRRSKSERNGASSSDSGNKSASDKISSLSPFRLEQQELALEWPSDSRFFDKRSQSEEKNSKACDNDVLAISCRRRGEVTETNILNGRYETIEQAIEDVKEGEECQYDDVDDICEDVKSGNVSLLDALMIASAIHVAQDEEQGHEYIDDAEDYAREEQDEDFYDKDEEECGFDDEPELNERTGGPLYSYNPRGFGGCGGSYSESCAEWDPDDNW